MAFIVFAAFFVAMVIVNFMMLGYAHKDPFIKERSPIDLFVAAFFFAPIMWILLLCFFAYRWGEKQCEL